MLFSLVGAAAAVMTPVELVIDCSTWDGKAETEIKVRFEAWDGTTADDVMTIFPGSTPEAPVLGFKLILRGHSWRYEVLDRNRIVVRGSQTSPIRRVSIKSDGWVPKYTFVPIKLPAVAPPPRELTR